ncbi:MAG: MarR family winged helix-turn-helix transcriptional regulator [Parasphingorhabdus sp.]|uniref:MarR family winged helix-turn-helix transcriptional regulator n=1 Tax=Parasphingorhabdus sp. TaxID=2709688 RepID=UPI003299A8FB
MTKVTKAQKFRQSSFGFLIQLLSRRIEARMKAQLAEIDLDIKMFSNLMMLREGDGITQRQLAKLVDFPEYSTSRNVDALENAGLVERRRDPNSRRTHLIYFTPAGKKKADLLPAMIEANNKETLEDLSDAEIEKVIKLLHKAAKIPEEGDANL